jgi:serine/threonine protein kinase/ABC-type phosphate/phosphonate transport system substrate-binding protein
VTPRAKPTAAEREARFARWVGREIAGRYRLTRFIGAGGMGAVFEAESLRSGRHWAIKIFEKTQPNWDRRARRVVREVRIASRIRHPNIVAVVRAGEDPATGALFIVQELLHGEDLQRELMTCGALSPAETVAVVLPIAEALEAVHLLGIVHRDVSPSNVFLSRDGDRVVPKLIDFGLSRVMDDADRHAVTEPGEQVMGTPFYISPEQARGVAIDARSDLWSLGAILYRCLAGQPPHVAPDVPALLKKLGTDRPLPVDQYAEVPTPLAAIVHRLLEPDRDRRFDDATELVRALRGAGVGDELPTTTAFRLPASTFVAPPEGPAEGASSIAPPLWLPWARAASTAAPNSSRGATLSMPNAPPRSLRVSRPARSRMLIGAVVDAHGLRGVDVERASQALRRIMGVVTFESYPHLIDALAEGGVDLAWLPPVAMARAARAGAARLMLTIERDGRRSHSAALLARTEIATRGLDGLADTRAAWVDPWSAAGYLVPRRMLRVAGLGPDETFRSQAFVGNHDEVLAALVEGRADVGAMHCRVDASGVVLEAPFLGASGVSVLAVGREPIPGDAICASAALTEREARATAQRFLEAAEDRKFRPTIRLLWPDGRFVAANPSRYDGIVLALAEEFAPTS